MWSGVLSRAWRWPLRIVGSALLLAAIVVIALGFVFHTEVGTRFALSRGVSFYDGLIPGGASVSEVEGTLARGVTMRGVRLEDRRGRPLITAEQVSLRVPPLPLAKLEVRPGTVRIEGVDVHVIDATIGGFADLGPEGRDRERHDTGLLGPDLPVSIAGTVDVKRARVLRVTPGFEPVTWIDVPELSVTAEGQGTWANAAVEGRAKIPDEDLEVFHLALEAEWTSPSAVVHSLFVQSNAMTVEGRGLRVDLKRSTFVVEDLETNVDASWLGHRIGTRPRDDVRLTVDASGSTSEFSADVWARAPELANGALALDGAITPRLDLDALLSVGVDASSFASGDAASPLDVLLGARVQGDLWEGLDVHLEGRCHGCLDKSGAVELSAVASGGLESAWASGEASIRGQGVSLEAAVTSSPWGWAVGRASVDVDELEALRPAISAAAPDLELGGRLDVDAVCGASTDLQLGGCWTRAELQRGRPLDHASVEAFAWTPRARHLQVVIARLGLRARDVKLRLLDDAARLRISPQRIAVDDVGLSVQNRTGSGSIYAHGYLGFEGSRPLAATVRLRTVSLSALDAFVPEAQGDGVVDASVDASGSLAEPSVLANVRGDGLRAFGLSLGELDLSARYRAAQASVRGSLRGRDVGVVRIEARVPLLVGLDGGRVEPRALADASLEASIEGTPLTTLPRFVPELRGLRGSLSMRASVDGSLRRPRVRAELSLDRAEFDGHRLPDVEVVGSYLESSGQGLVELGLQATHPSAFERVDAEASVPVDLGFDPQRPRVLWRRSDEHRVDVEVAGAELDTVGEWRDGLQMRGQVDLVASLRGTAVKPRIDAELQTRGVAYAQRPVGDLAASVAYSDEEASLQLHASGPEVSGLGLVATVPLSLRLATGTVRWHADRPHRVRVSVSDLLLEEAVRWLPPPEDSPQDPIAVGGRLSAYVALDGTPSEPSGSADVSVERASYGGRPLGELELTASYDSARARAELDWMRTERHTAHASVDIPLAIDLEQANFAWKHDGEHHVRVAVPLLDRTLLDPFVDTGELNAAAAVHVVLDGHPRAFEGGASVVGVLRAHGQKHRVRANVDVNQDRQKLMLDLGVGTTSSNWAHVEGTMQARIGELLDGGDWRTTPLEVTAEVRDIDLRQISGLTPVAVQDLRGRLDVHARVDGTLGEPRIDGRVALTNGEATVVAARQRLRGVELTATLNNERIEVNRLRLESGGGTLEGNGAVKISQGVGLAGRIELNADRLPIRKPGLPRMAFSGKVDTILDVGIETVSVEVDVASGRVDVATSRIKAPKSVPTNDDVGFVDFDEPPPREVTYIPPKKAPPKRETEVKVVLVDPLKIIGPSVDMEWGGRVQANTTGAGATADGALTAEGGGFELLGNAFRIERGAVTLPKDGTNVPFIDLVAKTSVEEVDITASIRGPLLRPELELSSSPSMSESDIFAVLVTGSTDTQDADPEQVEAKAAGVLAAMTNPALQRQLNEKLRVDKVGVAFGESTDQPILTVGKHVSKNVYAETEYHHNAPENENRAELRIEYDFAPRWSLETFFGDAAAGGVDVFWGRAFDTTRNVRNERGAPPNQNLQSSDIPEAGLRAER